MTSIRQPAVAGMFYTADPAQLRAEVADYLARGAQKTQKSGNTKAPSPAAIAVPHAGHMYSGAVAGCGYATVDWSAVQQVVLVGPAHRVPVRGVAHAGVEAFRTPLGDVTVPQDMVQLLHDALGELFVRSPEVHRYEHCVEVQLPFIQVAAPGVPVLPLVAGDATPEEMAALAATALRVPGTLFVVSTDLSHYLPDDEARLVDEDTLQRVLALEVPLPPYRACGAVPLNGLLKYSRDEGLTPTVVATATSADVPAGSPDRVVGYGAIRFDEVGQVLPGIAREVLEEALGVESSAYSAGRGVEKEEEDAAAGNAGEENEDAARNPVTRDNDALMGHPWLHAPAATFVTLTLHGQLRGCIGRLQAARPLLEDVRSNALSAAFEDPRFPALTAAELQEVTIEVSVLTEPEVIPGVHDERSAAAALKPGVDGVILTAGPYRGTFLPQVWEQLPDPAEFIRHLKVKAGLHTAGWPHGTVLERYRVRAWTAEPGE